MDFFGVGDMIGKNAKRIVEYVRNKLQEEMMYDQISIKEYKELFNGLSKKCNYYLE